MVLRYDIGLELGRIKRALFEIKAHGVSAVALSTWNNCPQALELQLRGFVPESHNRVDELEIMRAEFGQHCKTPFKGIDSAKTVKAEVQHQPNPNPVKERGWVGMGGKSRASLLLVISIDPANRLSSTSLDRP